MEKKQVYTGVVRYFKEEKDIGLWGYIDTISPRTSEIRDGKRVPRDVFFREPAVDTQLLAKITLNMDVNFTLKAGVTDSGSLVADRIWLETSEVAAISL